MRDWVVYIIATHFTRNHGFFWKHFSIINIPSSLEILHLFPLDVSYLDDDGRLVFAAGGVMVPPALLKEMQVLRDNLPGLKEKYPKFCFEWAACDQKENGDFSCKSYSWFVLNSTDMTKLWVWVCQFHSAHLCRKNVKALHAFAVRHNF